MAKSCISLRVTCGILLVTPFLKSATTSTLGNRKHAYSDEFLCRTENREVDANGSGIYKTGGLLDSNWRWEFFDVKINQESFFFWEHILIELAVQKVRMYLPCLFFRFWPGDSEPSSGDYVFVTRDKEGCYANVGRQGGKQILNLGHKCMDQGIIIHELFHSLGISHEQKRTDRDDYVTILWENIRPSERYNFEKDPPGVFGDFGVPYNYKSIMHYSSLAFSMNGKPTILAKNGSTTSFIEDLLEVQPSDILKLQRMYNCTGATFTL